MAVHRGRRQRRPPVLAKPGKGYEVWDAHDTVRFSDNVRGARPAARRAPRRRVVRVRRRDRRRARRWAARDRGIRARRVLIVLFVLGANRHGASRSSAARPGRSLMLGGASLLGLKINFLDFVALPITIGIGIEYAVNIVTRARQDSGGTRGRRDTAARSCCARTRRSSATARCSCHRTSGSARSASPRCSARSPACSSRCCSPPRSCP